MGRISRRLRLRASACHCVALRLLLMGPVLPNCTAFEHILFLLGHNWVFKHIIEEDTQALF